jgi:hypothetical protein
LTGSQISWTTVSVVRRMPTRISADLRDFIFHCAGHRSRYSGDTAYAAAHRSW